MPRLHEVLNKKEDKAQWVGQIEKWGKQFWKDTKSHEPRVTKLPDEGETWTFDDYFKHNYRIFIIYTDDDTPCGYAIIHTYGPDRNKVMWISELYVDLPHRGKGIGRFVLNYFEEFAKDNKYGVMFIQNFVNNTRAGHLYTSCGFQEWSSTKVKFLR